MWSVNNAGVTVSVTNVPSMATEFTTGCGVEKSPSALTSKASPGGSEFGSRSSEKVMTISVPLAVPETKVGTVLSISNVGSLMPVGAVAASSLSAVSAMFWAEANARVMVPVRLAMSPPVSVTS